MIKVRFCPDEGEGGVCSFASWDNEHLQEALRQAFNESPREQLVQIDVTREGVRAYFKSRNVAG